MEALLEPTDVTFQVYYEVEIAACKPAHREVQRARDGRTPHMHDAHANDATCKAEISCVKPSANRRQRCPTNRFQRGDTLRRLLRDGEADYGSDSLKAVLRREALLLADAWEQDSHDEVNRCFASEMSADFRLVNNVLGNIGGDL